MSQFVWQGTEECYARSLPRFSVYTFEQSSHCWFTAIVSRFTRDLDYACLFYVFSFPLEDLHNVKYFSDGIFSLLFWCVRFSSMVITVAITSRVIIKCPINAGYLRLRSFTIHSKTCLLRVMIMAF